MNYIPSRTPSARAARQVLLSVPHMGGNEQRYVKEAFDSNWLTTVGPNLTALEKEFSQMVGQHAVAVASGTAGLHLAMRLAGVGPGDEVVAPTLTFAATVNPILYERARPVFVDSEPRTWNMDVNLLSDLLSERARKNRLPRAVVVVHLFGLSAELSIIRGLCRQYGLALIEDAAESIGARYQGRHPGTFGSMGVFSFNGNKMITGTTGGMLITSSAARAEHARKWSQQARDADPLGLNNYVHSELGFNYRMSNVVAGIVRGQLEVLETRVQQRRAVFHRYFTGLADVPGLEPQFEPPGCRHSRWLSCFMVDENKFGMTARELIQFLDAANVETRPVWRPMHTQPLYEEFEVIGGAVAEDLNRRGICLPSSSLLALEDQEFVIARIIEAHRMTAGRSPAFFTRTRTNGHAPRRLMAHAVHESAHRI
jgi:dTDP-4-amino-4,6-dideoxygalactose transaminase